MSCDEPTKGRYVSIYMSRHELLALAEVEVFGTVVAGKYNPLFRLNLQTSESHSIFCPFSYRLHRMLFTFRGKL